MKKVFLSLFAPFLLWLFINQGIFTEQYFLGSDNTQYFHWILYHVEHLSRGVYPLWNPFHAWGFVDNFDMLFMGPFNPIYCVMALLVRFQVDAYSVYVGTMLAYLILAYVGIYALARRLIGGHWWAWLVYLLFLFSGFGSIVLTQLVVLLMYVPTIWFFFFLISFVQSDNVKSRHIYALAASLAMAIALNSYVPVFFIFIFLSFLAVCFFIRLRWLINGFMAIGQLVRQAPWLFVLCLVGMSLSVLPDVLWYTQASPSEYVLKLDRADENSSHPAEVSTELAIKSGVAVVGSWEELFTDFESSQNFYIFVPAIIFILILMSLFNRFLIWQVIVFFMGLIILLFSLTITTPLFNFLWKHIYIFHLFRNYFFFAPFIVSLGVLFLVGQLKVFLNTGELTVVQRWLRTFFIIVAHSCFFLFLSTLDMVPKVSFGTVILSAVWFLGWTWKGTQKNQAIFLIVLGAISLIQPVYVLSFYGSLARTSLSPHPVSKQSFSYLRPIKGQGINEEHGFHRRIKQSIDESGFVKAGYMGTRWSYDLAMNVPYQELQEYVRHKFVLYDCTVFMNSQRPDWDLLGFTLNAKSNLAYVNRQEDVGCNQTVDGQGQAWMVEGATNSLKVTEFNVNSIHIQTDLKSKKFMVYNDSFHPQWHAWIDGKSVVIDQANMAFKGIWVKPGKHQIIFQYGPVWVSWVLMGTVLAFLVWFLAVIYFLTGIKIYETEL